jgi:hypothetical protein
MKNMKLYLSLVFVLLTFTMSSCDVIGDIFKAGMWTAIIIIVIIILLVMWIIRKFRGPRKRI